MQFQASPRRKASQHKIIHITHTHMRAHTHTHAHAQRTSRRYREFEGLRANLHRLAPSVTINSGSFHVELRMSGHFGLGHKTACFCANVLVCFSTGPPVGVTTSSNVGRFEELFASIGKMRKTSCSHTLK